MSRIDLCNGVGCPRRTGCQRWVKYVMIKNKKLKCPVWWVDPAWKDGRCRNFIGF